jgi:hypothetical protein
LNEGCLSGFLSSFLQDVKEEWRERSTRSIGVLERFLEEFQDGKRLISPTTVSTNWTGGIGADQCPTVLKIS